MDTKMRTQTILQSLGQKIRFKIGTITGSCDLRVTSKNCKIYDLVHSNPWYLFFPYFFKASRSIFRSITRSVKHSQDYCSFGGLIQVRYFHGLWFGITFEFLQERTNNHFQHLHWSHFHSQSYQSSILTIFNPTESRDTTTKNHI